MAERDADYRGFHIITNAAPTPDHKWRARSTLHEQVGRVTPLLAVERLTEEESFEASLDQAQREIDKILLFRGFADDQEAELRSRRHLG
jgi:hypothetical protein